MVDLASLEMLEEDLHVGFSGTQQGTTDLQLAAVEPVIFGLAPGWFHHGWCIGADEEVDPIARKHGFEIIGHPPINTSKMAKSLPEPTIMCEPREYLPRNTDITIASSILIATPKGYKEEHFSGTWSTIRRARKHCQFIILIYPNGTWEVEVTDGYATA